MMTCKYCGAQLDEGVTLCPFCEKDNAETESMEQLAQELPEEEIAEIAETEETVCEVEEGAAEEATNEISTEEVPQKAKPKIWKIIVSILGGIVLLGVLVGAILYALGVDLKPRENDLFYKDTYAIDPGKAESVADDEIAVVDDSVLTNAQLQVYYNMTVNDFLSYYGYYLSALGLDSSKPFDQQVCYLEENMNWQQYFLDKALNVWHRYTVLNRMAKRDGVVLADELQQQIDQLQVEMEQWAAQYGFADVQEMLEADFGPICNMDAYMDYMHTYYLAMQYQEEKRAEHEPTQEEVEAYFAANEAMFADQGITKNSGSYYDVRHILIPVEGGTQDESGQVTYSDEEWAKCLSTAEAVLEDWKKGEATEASFADYAKQYSTDTGSKDNGGLYSQLTSETNFVEEFKQWYLDESRQVGDTGLVQSVYGYHIMYFSGSEEIWRSNAEITLISENWNTLIEEGMEIWPMEVNYKKIALCEREEEETSSETTVPTQESATDTTAATTE